MGFAVRTDDFRRSANIEDDREGSASRGMPGGAGGLGIGVVIIVTLVGWYLGIDPKVCFLGPNQLPALSLGRRWGRSIVRATSACISTPRFLTICRTSLAPVRTTRPASSPRLMSSPTKLVITSRMSLAYCRA